jgi:hypothetical protein
MGEDKLTVVAELPAPFQQTALEGARRRTADDGLPFLPQTDKRASMNPQCGRLSGMSWGHRSTASWAGRKTCIRRRWIFMWGRRLVPASREAGDKGNLPRQ